MAWWSGTVTATNGSANVTIVSGDPIDNLVSGNALIIGSNFNPVEIKRAYFNGTNNIIELVSVWPNATQTSQPAKSFTTDADLIPIGKTLALYLNSFTKASQTDAVTGTDNNNLMTPLRTKEAVQALVKSAAYLDATTSKLDHTLGRVFKMGDLGMGRTLDLRTSTGGAYADYDTPQKCYNKGTLFGFIDGASLGIPNYSASAYGVLTIHGHYTDASGAMGTCQEFRYGADVWIRAYASATTWTSWTKLLKTGDYGQGSVGQMPAVPVSDLNLLNISGDFSVPPDTSNWPFGSYGGILRHSSHGNNQYSMQIASEAQNKKTKVRYRQVGGVWTAWTDFLQLGDFGIGGTGGAYTRCDNANTLTGTGMYWTSATWVGSPESGLDGANQGYLIHQDWGTDNAYALQKFYSVNGAYTCLVRRKDYGTWTRWFAEGEAVGYKGNTRSRPTMDYSTNVDLNTLTKAGWYNLLANPTNSSNFPPQPTNSTGWWFIHNIVYNDGAQIQQYAYSYMTCDASGNPSDSYIFVRVYYSNSGAWSKWQKIAGPDVGLVYYDATSGRNVGAIIERGVNPNGEYVKFADSTMICKLQYNETADITTTEGALYRNASGITWNYPAQFVDYPVVTGQFPACGGWLSQRVNGIVSCIYYWQAALNFSADGNAQVMAIGRWR